MIKAAREATAPAHGWTAADVAARDALEAAVHAAIVPITHVITITPAHGGAAPVVNHGEVSGQVGRPLTFRISAANAPLRFAATGLPAGLALDSATGVISGTPTAALADGTIQVTASNAAGSGGGTLRLTIRVPQPRPALTSPATASGTVGQPFRYQIATSVAAGKFYATGLPAGLNLDSATGAITGTPQTPGTALVLLSGENAGGNGPAVTLQITIAAAGPRPRSAEPAAVSGRAGTSVADAASRALPAPHRQPLFQGRDLSLERQRAAAPPRGAGARSRRAGRGRAPGRRARGRGRGAGAAPSARAAGRGR